MKKSIVYIVNPISGTQRKRRVAELALELTDREVFEEPRLLQTEHAGHAEELARRAVEEGVNVVVAVGGDGTVNEVGRALVHTDTALAIIPCGSGNGLARHLDIPLAPKGAIEIINRAVIHTLDFGRINEHPFFCTCGIGFDAYVSQKFAEAGKRGFKTYVENTLFSGFSYKPQTYTITNHGETTTCPAFLIACANASQYGNDALIAPYASMKDGLLDVVIMKPFSTIESPQVILQLFAGTLPESSHVRTLRTDHLHILREEDGPAHFDGDAFMTGKEIDIRLVRQGLNVVVNESKRRFRLTPTSVLGARLFPRLFHEWLRDPERFLKEAHNGFKRSGKAWLERFTSGW